MFIEVELIVTLSSRAFLYIRFVFLRSVFAARPTSPNGDFQGGNGVSCAKRRKFPRTSAVVKGSRE